MQTNLFTSGQNSGAAASAAPAGNIADSPSDLFTKLLVAQVKNQNPLEPTDPSQFVNQLTQLSQMESLKQLSSQAAANASMLQSMQVLAMGAQVGSQLSVQSDRVQLGDKLIQGSFALGNASAQTTVVLTAADGSEKRVELGTRSAGDVNFTLDPARLGLPAGSYGLRVETASGELPPVEITGDLASVKLSPSGGIALNVTGVGEVLPSAVTRFNGRQTASAS
ncbi:MAG TPA: flagellar hook capping FlgD N-terminal domain-containing protein [Azonexus sp.]